MITLIDGDFLLFICTHNKDKSSNLTLNSVIDSADTFIKEILTRVESNQYLGFLTASPNFRKVEYPEYKKNRTSKPLPEFFIELRNYLKDTWGFIEEPLYEADDLVNIYSHYFNGTSDTIIVSPDKDVLKLHGRHYNPIKKEFIITTIEEAIDFFWRSMIKGDSTDNISGIHGRGDKFIDKYFEENLGIGLHILVFNAYMEAYPEYKAMKEFYRNYRLLKILEKPLNEEFTYYKPILLDNDFRRIHENNPQNTEATGG